MDKPTTQISGWMLALLNDYTAQVLLSKSKPTVQAYTSDVTRFLEYVHSKGLKRITQLKAQVVISYLGHQKSLDKSDASLARYYMSIRSFCRFLRKIKAVPDDITLDVCVPLVRQIEPYVPTLDETALILDQPDKGTESGRRDKAMLEVLYSSGLRASELCDLRLEDWAQDSITVRRGKRCKTRTVPLTESASQAIQDYVAKDRGRDSGPLFQTIMGKKLRRQLLSKIVGTYAKKAGIEGITTHTLRHACATHLLDQGADLRLIQEVLGHSSIASTQRYTHLSSNKMQEMFKQFHPRKGI